jgi:integrase/recombinase XerC
MADEPISELIESFGRYLRTSSELLPRSQQAYLREIKAFAQALADPTPEDLTPQVLVDWHSALVDRGLRASTLQVKRTALYHFFTWLDEVMEDPAADRLLKILKRLKSPRDSQAPVRTTYAPDEQVVQKMLTAARQAHTGARDGPMLHFLWVTGIRRSELVNLRLDDLDMENRRVRILGKGEKLRFVRFTQACQQDLAQWLVIRAAAHPVDDYVFISARTKGRMPANSLNEIFQRCAQKAKIRKEVWPHLFRHRGITEMVKAAGLPMAAKFAGHSNIQTTMGYFHEDEGDMDRAYDKAMGEEDEPEEETVNG